MKNRLNAYLQTMCLLLLISAAAMAVHGYHPYVEDAEIYLPGIKKLLNPQLYPQNAGFFASHASMTVFPNLIAASVRATHLPFDWVLLGWQFLCILGLLAACWKIGRFAFGSALAAWGGVALVASLLTLPVAGTALYLMDQYLNTRSLSAAAVLLMVACAVERRYLSAAGLALFTAAVHPLMFVFGACFACVHAAVRMLPAKLASESTQIGEDVQPAYQPIESAAGSSHAIVVGLGLPSILVGMVSARWLPAIASRLFPPLTPIYHQVLLTRPYFFLARWEWYELLGMVAPFAIFWWFGRIARRRGLADLESLCQALIYFGAIFALASLLTILPAFERFTLLQPMRYLHLAYILMSIIAGGLLAETMLQRHPWRWLVLFLPLCAGMAYAQHEVFPATPQLELPGMASPNPWVQAFLWIRDNTPSNAYFVLNPNHMKLPGEDHHGFRALAERSMMADNRKDSGAVSMFPQMAETWKKQTAAQAAWKTFGREDLLRLRHDFGVDWAVLDGGSDLGLPCPYRNARLAVCRIE